MDHPFRLGIYTDPAGQIAYEQAVPDDPRYERIIITSASEMRAVSQGLDVLCMARSYDRQMVLNARRLKWLQLGGTGIDRLQPLDELDPRLMITNSPGLNAEMMADYVLCVMLMHAWNFGHLLRNQHEHRWERIPADRMAGKVAVLIGFGHIGRAILRRLRLIGMKVVGVRRSGNPVPGVERMVDQDGLHEILGVGDFVILAVPLTSETRGMIGPRELGLMRRSAFLINISRGAVVQENALADALRAGDIAGAALDVFETEPLPHDSELWDLDRVILTPHISSWSEDYRSRTAAIFAMNLERFLAGRPLHYVVDRSRGYWPAAPPALTGWPAAGPSRFRNQSKTGEEEPTVTQSSFEIADLVVRPGERGFTRVHVTGLLSGGSLALPLHVVNGMEEGPVLGITSAIHGAEYHPIRMIKGALELVDTRSLRGTIVAVPVCNPLAFARGTRVTPDEDDVDFANLNRVFPGYRKKALFGVGEPPSSDHSLTETLAAVLNEVLLPRITHLIDFHCHAQELALIKCIQHNDQSGDQGAVTAGMSRALGLGLIHEHAANPATLTGRAAELGISTCVPEIGGGRLSAPAEARAVQLGVRAILNVLKYLGMMEGEIEIPARQLVFEIAPHVRPTTSGYLVSQFDPDELFTGEETGIPVKAGQVLGTIFDPYTLGDLETLRATADGILYIARRSGPIATGGHAYSVADFEQSHWIQ